MSQRTAWLYAAALAIGVLGMTTREARASDPLKPYVVLILDTSGSMDDATTSGAPSCGGADHKLDHARCAINSIANSYGDMVFALGIFRETIAANGAFSSCGASCTMTGVNCDNCNCNAADGTCGTNCTAAMASDARLEMISGLDATTNQQAAVWTDFVCNSCGSQTSTAASEPEVWKTAGSTPLGGALKGAKRYWQGLQATDGTTLWPAAQAGFAPILADPLKDRFLPKTTSGSTKCNADPRSCTPEPMTGHCTGDNCCCASQCRPYITILLTDGDETCGGNAPAAATALRTTDIGTCTTGGATCTADADCAAANRPCVLKRYTVQTKPIFFGPNPTNVNGDGDIENIAHAGNGGIDNMGRDGYYASDEASLEVALSQILSDSIRTEVCNGADDDCDGKVDEGFNVGATCTNGKLGACLRTGLTKCDAAQSGVTCDADTTPTGTAEICNGIDDDCDGKIDEGVAGCNCVVQGETCNNMDDDCDGNTDEGLTRSCGTGTCTGIETCNKGNYEGCTAKLPTTEICNGKDDDCDGVIDGVTQECSSLPTVPPHPAGSPLNNPAGDPTSGCFMEGPSICVCRPGSQSCPVGGTGATTTCVGEVKPGTEICNGLDDDCDGKIDEGTGGQDCSTTCGIGSTVCTAGVITCTATTAGSDDTCDGVDDDCDGHIDEDFMGGDCNAAGVCNGKQQCIAGHVTCEGTPITQESCNCLDDDCDGTVDNGDLCPAGSTCKDCQCAFPCASGEIQCPSGKFCNADNLCVADPCFNITCPDVPGHAQQCVAQGNNHVCQDICQPGKCASPLVCKADTGECVVDNCNSFPERCTAQEVCSNGTCVHNPCAGVTCDAGQYCVDATGSGTGTCVASCAGVECGSGQRCELGACVADPCGHACPSDQVCHDATGECQPNPCDQVLCVTGQSCDPHGDGTCSGDPCLGTTCPSPDQVCVRGTCDVPMATTNDAGEEHVTTGGGGGCSTGGGDGGLLAIAVVGLALATRRRRGGKAVRA